MGITGVSNSVYASRSIACLVNGNRAARWLLHALLVLLTAETLLALYQDSRKTSRLRGKRS